MFNVLFTDLPEVFYTVNFFPGLKLGPTSLTLVLGLGLAVAVALAAAFFYFKKSLSPKFYFSSIVILLFAAAWLPLYLNLFYNSVYDLTENFNYLKLSSSSQRLLRLCQMDNRQDLGGIYCRLFSFVSAAKSNLPAGATVQFLTAPGLEAYLEYFLYPNLKVFNGANYIIFYFPEGYAYDNGQLFKISGGEKTPVGRYDIIFKKSGSELILKKF